MLYKANDEHARVTAAAHLLGASMGVRVYIRPQPGYRTGCGLAMWRSYQGDRKPYQGAAYPNQGNGERIFFVYDPATLSARQLWWGFLHELGHIAQFHAGIYRTEDDSPIQVMSSEIDAWNRAQQMAQHSPWPPDDDFYALRGECLATYGLAA